MDAYGEIAREGFGTYRKDPLQSVSHRIEVLKLYIMENTSDVREAIRELARSLKPTEEQVKEEILYRWRFLCCGCPEKMSLKNWIPQWTDLYTRGKRMNPAEFQDEKGRIRDFLHAIHPINSAFAGHRKESLYRKRLNFYRVIRDFEYDQF